MNNRRSTARIFLAAVAGLLISCNRQTLVSCDILGVAASGTKVFVLRKSETSTLHSGGVFQPDPPRIVSSSYVVESLELMPSTSPAEWREASIPQHLDVLEEKRGSTTLGRFFLVGAEESSLWGDVDLVDRVRSELASRCPESKFRQAWAVSGVVVADCGKSIYYFPHSLPGPICGMSLEAQPYRNEPDRLRHSISFDARSDTLGLLDRGLNLIESSNCGNHIQTRSLERFLPPWTRDPKWDLRLVRTDGEVAILHLSSLAFGKSALVAVDSRDSSVTALPSRALNVWATSVDNEFVWEDGQRGAIHMFDGKRDRVLTEP